MKRIAFALLIAGMVGCAEGPTQPTAMPFQTIYAYRNSGIISKRGEVISSRERWSQVWSEIQSRRFPALPLPHVDFDDEVVVVVAMGENPDACWTLEIEAIEKRRSDLEVFVKESRPPQSCTCPPITVEPVHVVRVPTRIASGHFSVRKVFEGTPCGP